MNLSLRAGNSRYNYSPCCQGSSIGIERATVNATCSNVETLVRFLATSSYRNPLTGPLDKGTAMDSEKSESSINVSVLVAER